MQYGPNNVPVRAIAVMSMVSLAFIFVGPLNTLGTILTIPFVFTYAAVDYAYFSLAVSEDIRKRREARMWAERRRSESDGGNTKESGRRDCNGHVQCAADEGFPTNVDGDVKDDDYECDLDLLFPVDRKRRRVKTADKHHKDRGGYQLIDGSVPLPETPSQESGGKCECPAHQLHCGSHNAPRRARDFVYDTLC
jgi:hypothetical protein